MNEDKVYMLRKIAMMFTCILVFVTLGLVVVNFQSKTVEIDYYGEVTTVKTMSNTVEGLLMQSKIYIDENTIVTPGYESRLEDNMTIKIYSDEETAKLDLQKYYDLASTKIVEKVVEEIQFIDFAKEEKSNASLERGNTNVIQEGQNGEKVSTYIIKYENDVEIERALLSEEVSKESVTQIVDVGTAIPTSSRGDAYRVNANDLVADSGFKQYNIRLSKDEQVYAYNISKKYGIQYELFLALMYVESGFVPTKISATNDYGLCQINISNHAGLTKTLGITNFLDPYQSMHAGAYWLSRYFNSWGKAGSTGSLLEINALNSYNRGDGSYKNYLAAGNSPTSWYYGNKVTSARDRLIANGGL